MQQWGYSAFIYGGKKVTFPIPYAVQCYGVVSQNIQTTTNFIVCAINDVDITGFWDSNGSRIGIYWFAFGNQQWGYEITFTAKTIVFPCPYTEIMPSVIGTSSGSSAKLAINANSLTSFNASNQAVQTIWWIAIGKQQWGSKNVTGDGGGHLLTTINFPVPYSESCYTVNANIVVTNSDYDIDKFIVIGGITLSSFKATIDSEVTDTEKTFKINWIAIGQQQIKRQH